MNSKKEDQAENLEGNKNGKLWIEWRKFQAESGVNQRDFAMRYGLRSVSNLSQYLHGNRPLNIDAALRFSRGMQVPLNRIIGKNLAKIINEAYNSLEHTPGLYSTEGRSVNVYTPVQATRAITGTYSGVDTTIHADYGENRCLIGVSVNSDDMSPLYRRGDILVVDLEMKPVETDKVLVVVESRREALIREYSVLEVDAQGKDVFELIPIDPRFPRFQSRDSGVKVVGVVVEHRSFRRV